MKAVDLAKLTLENQSIKTQILTAMVKAAKKGKSGVSIPNRYDTIPYSVIEELIDDGFSAYQDYCENTLEIDWYDALQKEIPNEPL
jgi:hypothetical protein